MPTSKEKEPMISGVENRAEEISPLIIERKEAVTPTPSKFTAQTLDDLGKPLIETPETKKISIEIPEDKEQLERLSRGSDEDTSTWSARYWLRMIKRALLLGWETIIKKFNNSKGQILF